ncbi:hypothetical protein [Candidatus Scalindua japonica]|uniref:hypothetical protein n=1 Tax=Candidatus Scalindua japonica TaxID=1284222 RepID=UPI0013A57043|nr:hypothetical protein [Candidatus Scalindua japonica]
MSTRIIEFTFVYNPFLTKKKPSVPDAPGREERVYVSLIKAVTKRHGNIINYYK